MLLRAARAIAVISVLAAAACAGPPTVASQTAAPSGTWADLAAQFAYDERAPLDARYEASAAVPGGTQTQLSFTSPRGGRASGFIVVPAAPGSRPAVLLMPGSNAAPSEMRSQALELVRRGAIALVIDQSQTRPGHQALFTFTAADRDAAIQTVVDLRRAVDLLAARPDVDRGRIGYWGFSHGAFLGGLLAGVDRRLAAFVLQSGGGADYMLQNAARQIADGAAAAAYRAAISTVDPDLYIARAAPAALLFQNGLLDRTYTDAGVNGWTGVASEPKEIRTYPTDHFLNADATTDAVAFLSAHLGLAPR